MYEVSGSEWDLGELKIWVLDVFLGFLWFMLSRCAFGVSTLLEYRFEFLVAMLDEKMGQSMDLKCWTKLEDTYNPFQARESQLI